jgi:hypothetical protein
MALLTWASGGDADMMCLAAHGVSPLSGMVPMYVLMSGFRREAHPNRFSSPVDAAILRERAADFALGDDARARLHYVPHTVRAEAVLERRAMPSTAQAIARTKNPCATPSRTSPADRTRFDSASCCRLFWARPSAARSTVAVAAACSSGSAQGCDAPNAAGGRHRRHPRLWRTC